MSTYKYKRQYHGPPNHRYIISVINILYLRNTRYLPHPKYVAERDSRAVYNKQTGQAGERLKAAVGGCCSAI